MRTSLRRWSLLGGAATALFSGLLLFAAPAFAHASVVDTSPADGARLKAVPHVVSIEFDENVGISASVGYLHVTDQKGDRVDAGAAYHPGGDGAKVADTLRSGLGNGSYTASWRVISADSHPVAGTFSFVVGSGALVRSHSGSTSNDDLVTSGAFDVARWISFGGVALLGGGWLLLTVWPVGRDEPRARRLVWAGWGAVSVGAVLELLIQGPFSAGDGLAKITDPALLNATLHIDYGVLHCVRMVLLGLLAPLLVAALQPGAEPRRRDALAGVLGLGVLVTFSDSGHAATTSPSWLSLVADVLHIGAMAVWLGGLLMLVGALLPRRDDDELRAVLPVFSRAAFTSVVVLAVTGTYAAWRGIGTIHAIFTTSYGLLVDAKIVLFVAILAVANLSRKLVRRRTVAYAMTATAAAAPVEELEGVDVPAERLRRAVFVEAVIGVVVLALTAVLVAQPRGKESLAASYRDPITRSAPLGGGRHVTVTADPGVHGLVDLTLTPSSRVQSITATATQHAHQLGPLTVPLHHSGTAWSGSVSLPVAGNWEIDLTVSSGANDAVTTDTIIDLH